MIPNIEKQIADLGEEKIRAIQKRFTVGDIVPYEYQCVAYVEIAKRLSRYEHPFFVKAAVSAGKTMMFAMVAAQCKKMSLKALFLARQSEIVDQDSKEISAFGVPNSVYCAGLNTKSAYFPIVVGSEGTVINGLNKALGDYVPQVLGIDECHQVNWNDIVEAEENGESIEQMMTTKGEQVEGNPLLIGTGRAQYTIIIFEMRRRCREVHGHELRIFGMTGSEYRGIDPILVEDKRIPGFWREQVTNIDTDYLVKFGSVVPTYFGNVGDLGYDLSEFTPVHEFGVADYDQKQLKAMSDKIHQSGTMTQRIMQMVNEVMKDRLCALVTCADARHCKEAAAALPPGTKYHIITGKTRDKQRREWLEDAYEGRVKYIFQVQALTTGVNIPPWDTSVILRKIGSLTLLTQLLGRGMRQLKTYHKEVLGMKKTDHLVFDFSGTMFEMGNLYFDPMLEQAQFQLRKSQNKETKYCPICNTENSFYARRCMHIDDNGNRCEYFWTYQTCDDQIDDRTKKVVVKGCWAKNDVAARVCRCCNVQLRDPNDNLSGKMYRKNDWCDVLNFEVTLTKNKAGVIFCYTLRDTGGVEFRAYEKYFPESDHKICKTLWTKAVRTHVLDRQAANFMITCRNAVKIMSYASQIMQPKRVTHRKNTKKEDLIAQKEF
ncbi:TPA_asm: ATP-dependent helicase [Salmonella enterica]|nr:ATP-dependent helicase [Salmonella enterica]HAS2179691.1 DEAD/DEAH box helicase family protein [Salmonella enterica subsp. enterica]